MLEIWLYIPNTQAVFAHEYENRCQNKWKTLLNFENQSYKIECVLAITTFAIRVSAHWKGVYFVVFTVYARVR